MIATLALPFILIGFVLLIIFVVLIFIIFRKLLINSSGWKELLERYQTNHSPEGQLFTKQTMQLGSTRMKNITTIYISPKGLFISIDNKNYILIPYTEFTETKETMLYWQKAHKISLKNISVKIIIFDNIFQVIKQYQ